jgi:phosphate transport system permease protein
MERQADWMITGHKTSTDANRYNLKKRLHPGEFFIQGFLFLCGVLSILITLGIVYEIGKEALLFFRSPQVDLWAFFTGVKWQPQAGEFGILSLVCAH